MTYDHWKTTNPADEFLGPNPEQPGTADPREYCEACGGEGKLYTSRYGGNDPDVWPIGKCEVCKGSGFVCVAAEPLDENDVAEIDAEIAEFEAAHV
jgi:hypothetical protein